ncbi:ECF transporter S component [Fusibacter sp. JL216-2]|uniref:ECF transporter S component n=1 Tax=Fusibacter sp. JL216-2 TaxID=3071453 RepID=UPI003D3430C9
MDTKKLVLAGLMAALATVGTIVIQIPTGGGYIHLGDSIVYLCGILLGPVLGGAAAAIGSMLADVFSGYAAYAIPTFLIKGIDAMVVGFIYMHLMKNKEGLVHTAIRYTVAFVPGGIIMMVGYAVTEYFFYGAGGVIGTFGPNFVQAFVGGALAFPLLVALEKAGVKRLISGHNH